MNASTCILDYLDLINFLIQLTATVGTVGGRGM